MNFFYWIFSIHYIKCHNIIKFINSLLLKKNATNKSSSWQIKLNILNKNITRYKKIRLYRFYYLWALACGGYYCELCESLYPVRSNKTRRNYYESVKPIKRSSLERILQCSIGTIFARFALSFTRITSQF